VAGAAARGSPPLPAAGPPRAGDSGGVGNGHAAGVGAAAGGARGAGEDEGDEAALARAMQESMAVIAQRKDAGVASARPPGSKTMRMLSTASKVKRGVTGFLKEVGQELMATHDD
jgi:hypothetical protein